MTGRHHPRADQRVRIQCWCGRRYGHITLERMRRGETFSCSPDCTAANALTRAPREDGQTKPRRRAAA